MTHLLSNEEVLSIFFLPIFFAVPLLCNRHYPIAVHKNHLYTTMFFVKSLSAVILAFALGHATRPLLRNDNVQRNPMLHKIFDRQLP